MAWPARFGWSAILEWRLISDQNVAAVDVFVHHLLGVNVAQYPGNIHRNPQFLGQLERRALDQLGQRLPLNVFQEQNRLAFGALFGQSRTHTGHVGQLPGNGMLIVQLVEMRAGWVLVGSFFEQDRLVVPRAGLQIQQKIAAMEGLSFHFRVSLPQRSLIRAPRLVSVPQEPDKEEWI